MTHPELYGMAAPPPAEPPQYDYVGGNAELDQLLAMEEDLYVRQAEVAKALEETKDRIKIALTSITRWVPEQVDGDRITPAHRAPFERYRIAVPGRVTRTLKWKTQRRFNSKGFKAAFPDVYEQWAPAKGAWYLEREK